MMTLWCPASEIRFKSSFLATSRATTDDHSNHPFADAYTSREFDANGVCSRPGNDFAERLQFRAEAIPLSHRTSSRIRRTTMQVQQILAVTLSCTLVFTSLDGYAITSPAYQAADASQSQAAPAATNQDLPSLVAPIALYPDALIAQILGASTYPTQVVEADRWLKQNSSLSGDALAKAVDQQSWDPSVKALTQFPSVLDNMSQNLSWTSALGDAYFNDQQDVMDTVQDLRARAKSAGTLQSNAQQTVSTEGQTIVIQPAQPQVVYVPTYNPTVVYGAPVPMYYGYAPYYPSTGAVVAASVLSFGVGIAVGAAISGGWGWGWGSWGCNWHGGSVTYNRNVYVSRSNTFVNRNNYYRGGNNYRPNYNPGNRPPRPPNNGNRPGNPGNRPGNPGNGNRPGNPGNGNRPGNPGNGGNRPGTPGNGGNSPGNRPGGGNNNPGNRPGNQPGGGNNRPGGGGNQPSTRPTNPSNRGYGQPQPGNKQGAFNGYNQGGAARQQSQRGQSSMNHSRPASRPTQSRSASGARRR
jgi:hypothetical protein